MPTVVTETDTFAATVSRPNNGELADGASINAFEAVDASRDRFLYNRHFAGNFAIGRFGAVGSGSVNDYPAMTAAAAAVVAAGGGTIWLDPGKSYRLDSQLDLNGIVNIRTMKGVTGSQPTRLIRNHSGRLIKIANGFGINTRTAPEFSDIAFEDAAANAQPMIEVQSGSSLALLRCYLKGTTGLTGAELIKMAGGEYAALRIRDCYLNPNSGQYAIRHQIGTLDIVGTVFQYPTTYSQAIILVDSVSAFDPAILRLTGNDFYAQQVSVGSATGVGGQGAFWSIAANGNTFRAPSAAFTAFAWAVAGANRRRLNVSGNSYEEATRYLPGGTPIAHGSELELDPYKNWIFSGAGVVPDGYRSVTMQSTTGITGVTLPTILFAGQELDLTVYNSTGGTTGFSVSNYGFKATQPTLNNATGASARFVADDPTGTGTLSWCQVGAWATVAP